jgi:hypothetical protein
MQINYRFRRDDPIIVGHLRQPEIHDVTTWQASDEYTLEFHPGHPTGYPIYIRPNNCGAKSNLPKIDTRNKFAADYATINQIANSEKLGTLSNAAKDDLLAVIRDEWDTLQKLSVRIWEGERVGEGKSVLELWAENEGADTGQHDVEISIGTLRKVLGGY